MDLNWKKNIYNSIKDLSNLDRQRELWLGFDKNFASSFDEDMSLLYDSFCFEEFISELYKDDNSKSIVYELYGLKDMLDSYVRRKTDEEILDDPDWLKVVNKAKQIIKLWDISKTM